jgi:hypothetical protein
MAMGTQRRQDIEALERAFWQSMVDGKAAVATRMLTEPALMVSGHGSIRFDHATYEKMAADDRHRLVDYRFGDFDVVFPTDDVAVASYQVTQSMERDGKAMTQDAYDSSTWVRIGDAWKCVAHTESLQAPQRR